MYMQEFLFIFLWIVFEISEDRNNCEAIKIV